MTASDPAPAPVAVEARRLSIRRAATPVLEDVDLKVRGGALVALIGPNGSGKTSLLLALAGLLPSVHGALRVGQLDPRAAGRNEVAGAVSFMPQATVFPFALPVSEVVLLGATGRLGLLGLASEADVRNARDAMRDLEIEHLADAAITRLSGGERQRALFATQLVQRAPVALFDEPTSAQDFRGISLIVRRLRALADAGTAVVSAVHDLNVAARHFDRLILLHDGGVAADGAPTAVCASDALQVAYQGAVKLLETPEGPVLLPRI